MTTTDTQTAMDLLEKDSTFRALVTVWWQSKECPVVLSDLLSDYDMHRQAAAVRWVVATHPHCVPSRYETEFNDWAFHTVEGNYINENWVSKELFEDHLRYIADDRSPQHALCALLDSYIGEY